MSAANDQIRADTNPSVLTLTLMATRPIVETRARHLAQ